MSKNNILQILACLVLGAMSGLATVFGAVFPFAAAFTMILPTHLGIPAAIGAIAMSAAFSGINALPLAAALGASFIMKFKGGALAGRCCISSGAYFLAAAAMSVLNGGTAWDIPKILFSGVFSACVFFAYSTAARRYMTASGIPLPLLGFCGFGLICALSSFGKGPFCAGAVLGTYLILLLAVRRGAGDAVLMGILTAAACGLHSPADFSPLALLGLAAMICGLTSFGSPVRASAVMLAVITPSAVIFGANAGSLSVLLDCAAASVIFVLSYSKVSAIFSSLIPEDKNDPPEFISERKSSALLELSDKLYRLSERECEKLPGVGETVREKVCSKCGSRDSCSKASSASFSELDCPADFYRAFPGCEKITEIQKTGLEEKKHAGYISMRQSKNRSDMKFCSDMLLCMDGLLRDSKRLPQPDRLLGIRLEKSLKKCGIRQLGVSVYPSGSAEIALPLSQKINEIRLCTILSEITGEDYLKPEKTQLGEMNIVRMTPKTAFSAHTGCCQLSALKEASGDVCDSFFCGRFFYAVLSDGMGRGAPARSAALALTGTLRELIKSGFKLKSAVDLCALIMRASLPEESFATLDILKADLSTGACEALKAGGCRSFLICDGEKSMLKPGGYPVGILSPCASEPQRFFVKNRAEILLISDGAQDLSPDAFSKIISKEKDLPLNELAALLIGSVEPGMKGRSDDISAMIVRIERNED